MEGGEFETYAAAEEGDDEEEFDVGDVERDRFRYDHVDSSMMLPKELLDNPNAALAAADPPKKRTSARKKAGTRAS